MTQAEPSTREEYLERFEANQRIEGAGVMDVRSVMPCPFCAAPDFKSFRIIDTHAAMLEEDRCDYCDRSAKWIIVEDVARELGTTHIELSAGEEKVSRIDYGGFFMSYAGREGDRTLEFVQTGGPDAPSYMDPAPRRIS